MLQHGNQMYEQLLIICRQSAGTFTAATPWFNQKAIKNTVGVIKTFPYRSCWGEPERAHTSETALLTSLVPRPHPLTRRNGLVDQVEFVGLAGALATL